MDKYEYRIRAEEINALIDKKEYVEAVKIADTIDWRRVKSVMMLCKISELYKINRRYEDSKEILLLAYERNPGSRKIVYSLCELAIKLEETVQAVEYYKEFVQIAPRDTGKFILQYRLYEAQDVSLEERIAVLEEYKKRDYREKWAYELAYLYHRIGLATRCVEECDELILWFGEGKYVIKAMELKMLHCPLTASQQEKYDRRFQAEEIATEHAENEEEQSLEENGLPIEIKAVDPSQAPTAKIPSKDVDKQLNEEAVKEDSDTEADEEAEVESDTNETIEKDADEEAEGEKEASESQTQEEEEIPLTQPDDDLDIKVKTIDVDNEYSTINLQQELAKNLASLMAEEDMGASDATMAMPFATLAEAATSDTIMGAITDDSIKNAIIAPLLQDTKELTPITEEDLLASMEEMIEEQPETNNAPKTLTTSDESDVVEEQFAKALQEEITPQLQTIAPEMEAQPAQPVQPIQEPEMEAQPAQPVQPIQEPEMEAQPAQPVQPIQEPEMEAQPAQPVQPIQEPEIEVQPAQPVQPVQEPEMEAQPAQPVQPIQEPEIEVQPAQPVKPTQEPEIEVQPAQPVQPTQEPEMEARPAQPVQETAKSSLGLEKNIEENTENNAEEKQEDGQITGQLSLEDIMAEWEETKKANEERRIQEMRERVIKQTGPMFSNFDAIARASVQADLDLINPAEEIFKNDHLDEEPPKKEIKELLEELKQEEIEEQEQQQQPEEAKQKEAIQKSSSTFNTEEIFGLEEKLLDVLNNPEMKEKSTPIEPIAIDSSFFENVDNTENDTVQKEEPVQVPVQPSAPESVSDVQNLTQVSAQNLTPDSVQFMPEHSQAQASVQFASEQAQAPVQFTPEQPQTQAPVQFIPEQPQAQAPIQFTPEQSETPVQAPAYSFVTTENIAENTVENPAPAFESTNYTASALVPTPTGYVEPTKAPSVAPSVYAASMEARPQSAAEAVAAMKAKTIVQETPTPGDLSKAEKVVASPSVPQPEQGISISKPVDLMSTDYIQSLIPQSQPEERGLTREEKARFAHFAPGKEAQSKVARALDSMTLATTGGNMFITGEHGTGTLQAAQNVVFQLKEKYPDFSGQVAKITGALLAEKDIGATLENLENSALIIEQAGDMPPDALGNLLFHLDRLRGHRIFVIMEDRKNEIERLSLLYPDLAVKFNARIDIDSLDNDGLVCYAKEYAKEKEYSIDDMGVLALYTKISDMQTNEHAVTVTEVREMIDRAIMNAEKKSMSHFMDIILAKRYDGDDMIVLREKDFLS